LSELETPPPVEAQSEDVTATKPKPGFGSSWLWDAAIILSIVFVIFVLYQPVHVEGTSMLPLLHDNDALFINKMVYHVESIHRGDVVVFRYPHDETKSYIKRVIALPGDDLRIEHGTVWVNGVRQSEPYVPIQYEDDRSQPEMTLGKGEYFVMGDHRSISSDSRDFGTVKRSLIYGKAEFVVWPLDQAGSIR
jgi:signal peptidase I